MKYFKQYLFISLSLIILHCQQKNSKIVNINKYYDSLDVEFNNSLDTLDLLRRWKYESIKSLQHFEIINSDSSLLIQKAYRGLTQEILYKSDSNGIRNKFLEFWLKMQVDSGNTIYVLERETEGERNHLYFYTEVEKQDFSTYYIFDKNFSSWDVYRLKQEKKGLLRNIYLIGILLQTNNYLINPKETSNDRPMIITMFNKRTISSYYLLNFSKEQLHQIQNSTQYLENNSRIY